MSVERRGRRRLTIVAALAALACAATPAAARSTRFLSISSIPSANGAGDQFNAPVQAYAVSQDQRYTRYFALVSAATNVVRGRGGRTDIFVLERGGAYANNGTPWKTGQIFAPVHALDGGRPDGNSYAPSLDGGFYAPARCMAFISTARDLVPGGSNGQPQAYVEDLATRNIRRVSVSTTGHQSNGPVTAVAIDEDCSRVAFIADATNLALTRAGDGAARNVTSRPAHGPQAYVRVISAAGYPAAEMNAGLVGTTFLASANGRGAAANAPVTDLAFANYGTEVAFSSSATNLGVTSSGLSNVYEGELGYGAGPMGSHPYAPVQRHVFLVSRTRAGRGGNGLSDHPAMSVNGGYVAYHTDASNILPHDTAGVGEIVRAATFEHPIGEQWVTGAPGGRGVEGDGPSDDPTMTWGAFIIEYQSQATDLTTDATHLLGTPSILSWDQTFDASRLESRNASGNPFQQPASDPVTSYFGNYMLFTVNGQVWLRYAPK